MRIYVALFASLLMAGTLLAQEQQDEIVVESDASGAGIIMMNRTTDDGSGPQSQMRVLSLNDMEGGFTFASPDVDFWGGGSDSFGLLNNPSVQKDLELIDDQLAKIKEINKDFGKKIKEQFSKMHNKDGKFELDLGSTGSIQEMIQSLQAEKKEAANS